MQILENFTAPKVTRPVRREAGAGEADIFSEFIDPADFSEYYDYLAAVRKERKMSKTAVTIASRVDGVVASGVSNSVLSKIENGQYGEPGFKLMVRIARGYGVPITNLAKFFL